MESATTVQQVEREVREFLQRARANSLRLAAEIHPRLDLGGYQLLVEIRDGVERSQRGVRGTELAEVLKVHKSTISRGFKALDRLGLLERELDPEDGRARLMSLTPETKARLEAVSAKRRQHLAQVLSNWDAEELDRLAFLLNKLNHDLG